MLILLIPLVPQISRLVDKALFKVIQQLAFLHELVFFLVPLALVRVSQEPISKLNFQVCRLVLALIFVRVVSLRQSVVLKLDLFVSCCAFEAKHLEVVLLGVPVSLPCERPHCPPEQPLVVQTLCEGEL